MVSEEKCIARERERIISNIQIKERIYLPLKLCWHETWLAIWNAMLRFLGFFILCYSFIKVLLLLQKFHNETEVPEHLFDSQLLSWYTIFHKTPRAMARCLSSQIASYRVAKNTSTYLRLPDPHLSQANCLSFKKNSTAGTDKLQQISIFTWFYTALKMYHC